MMEQKIKQEGIDIGGNIRRIRLEKGIGQTELTGMLDLEGIKMTRETLVKIERGLLWYACGCKASRVNRWHNL